MKILKAIWQKHIKIYVLFGSQRMNWAIQSYINKDWKDYSQILASVDVYVKSLNPQF